MDVQKTMLPFVAMALKIGRTDLWEIHADPPNLLVGPSLWRIIRGIDIVVTLAIVVRDYPAWYSRLQKTNWKAPPFYSWVNQLFLWSCSIANC
jgi:hypothetical protein